MSFLPNISVVETHELFNWFNNMFPILPIEFRLPASALRPTHQLRNTVALDIALDSQVDPVSLRSALEVLCAAHRRSVGERIAVVLCHDESTLNVVQNLLSSQPQLVLPGISELRVVDFGRFCEAYGHCTGVFDDSFHREDASTTDDGHCRDQSSRQHRRTQVYYASEVIPQLLYLGDFENGQNKAQLQALQITHVIDATNVMSSKQSAKEIGINYLAVNVEDRPDANIAQFFDSVIDFVKLALHPYDSSVGSSGRKPRILFHCRAGWSRSPTLLMVCMIEMFHYSLESALTAVLKSRPNVCPNPGFCTTLIEFERSTLKRRNTTTSHNNIDKESDDSEQTQSLSFQTKQDFMKHVAKLNIMWSKSVTEETNYDRMPIAASACPKYFSDESSDDPVAAEAALEARLREAGAFAVSDGDAPTASIAKKPFLRRGSKPVGK